MDIDTSRKLVRILSGKGNKDRLVPIGQQALDWLDKYQKDVRPLLVSDASGHVLFLSERGKPLSRTTLAATVKQLHAGSGYRETWCLPYSSPYGGNFDAGQWSRSAKPANLPWS